MMGTPFRTAALMATVLLVTSGYVPLSAQAAGQTATAPGAGGSSASLVPGRFARLSPHQQRIVRALFNAQRPTADGPAPLDLDQIAALGDRHGWRTAFKRMKKKGLIRAMSLSRVLSREARAAARTRQPDRFGTRMIALTDGSGRTFTAISDIGGVTGNGTP